MSPSPQPARSQRPDRALAWSVVLLLLAAYTATFSGLPDNPDAEVEFQTTSSLAREGRFALGGTPEGDAIVGYRYSVHEGGPGREGRFYSWFGVGQALVGLPFYFAGTALGGLFPAIEERHGTHTQMGAHRSEYFAHLMVGWRNPLLGALTGGLLFLCARRLGAKRRTAWIASLGYGLCTYAWPQARSTLSDVQCTFFLLLAFHQILCVRESLQSSRPPRLRDTSILGLALGGAFLTRVVVAPAIAVLVVALTVSMVDGRRRMGSLQGIGRDFLGFAGPALACVAFFLWVNQQRFGSPLETGYGDAVFSGTFFSYPPHWGFVSLLVAPGKGLFWLAPGVLLFALWAARLFQRGERWILWTLLAVVAAVFAPVVPTQTWHGAWTYGPRYILPALPFLWLGVAPALDALADGRRPHFGLGLGLVLAGSVTSLPGVLVDYTTHHDLALQGARIAWPDPGAPTESQRDDQRFLSIQWDWRFAAPWAHWRILRHRLAGRGESFPLREIFFLDDDRSATPAHERERGFLHMAWVDLAQRLGGVTWPAILVCLFLLWQGVALGVRGLRAT